MRVLMVNKFLERRGGAEAVCLGETELLRARGHEVELFGTMEASGPGKSPLATLPTLAHGRAADGTPSPHPASEDFMSAVDFPGERTLSWRGLRAAGRVLWSREAARKIAAACRRFRPDVAHLHNIAHHLSPSILHALRRARVPVVMTLHDYKVVCPAYTCLAPDGVCNRCSGGRFHQAVRHRCLGQSRLRSTVAALETYLHRGPLGSYALVDAYLAPSRFAAERVRDMGFPHPVTVVPNFVHDPGPVARHPEAGRLLYFGRLSPEKGITTLLTALEGTGLHLRVAGAGPLASSLHARAAALAGCRVEPLGHLESQALGEEIDTATAVVVPSECLENQPLAVLESFIRGCPVVASRLGGLAELVRDGETGVTFEAGSVPGLKEALAGIARDPVRATALGARARAAVLETHSPIRHIAALETIYARLAGRTAPSPLPIESPATAKVSSQAGSHAAH